jgi:hypothetical protein
MHFDSIPFRFKFPSLSNIPNISNNQGNGNANVNENNQDRALQDVTSVVQNILGIFPSQ